MSFAVDNEQSGYQASARGVRGPVNRESGQDLYGTRGFSAGPSTIGSQQSVNRLEEVSTRVTKDLLELNRRLALIQNQVNQLGSPQDGNELRQNLNASIKEAQEMAKNTIQTMKIFSKLVSENPSNEKKQLEKKN